MNVLETRRNDVIRLGRAGLDYLDVRGDRRTLIVAFFGRLPAQLRPEHFVIEGGQQITDIAIASIHIATDKSEAERAVLLRLDRAGDDSTYTLRVVGRADVDVLYAVLPFTFSNGGAAGAVDRDEHEPGLAPAATLLPERDGRQPPQHHVALVELFARVGDELGRFQDAVANEAYLASARRRTSIRRHARLLDYAMHDGCNARAWLSLSASADIGPIDPRGIIFSTTATSAMPAESFEPIGTRALHVYAAHSPMRLYAWGNHTYFLDAGATAATLRDGWDSAASGAEPRRALRHLEPGAHLLFEAVRGAAGENGSLADPSRRHVVQLTQVRPAVDPLYDTPIVEIEWARADRLPFRLPIAAPDPADPSAPPLECSVVWGNLVAVDHGRSIDMPDTLPTVPLESRAPYRPVLGQRNITFAEPPADGTLAGFNTRRPRMARAQISELVTTDRAGQRRLWLGVSDLLASGPEDAHYVAEVDENGLATLRFGDDVAGRRPPPGATVQARYRVGNGVAGNVGAGTIVNVAAVGESNKWPDLQVRNPLPACGGTAPESADDVRILAPSAARAQPASAVTPEDYARIAQRDPRLRRAAAQFCWTGSRTIVRVALDPLADEDLDPKLVTDVAAALESVRRIGHELQIVAAAYVPLHLALDIGVKHGYAPADVRKAVAAALSARVSRDGTRGLFHPEAVAFGGGIAQSAIVARVHTVAGVESISVTRFERLNASAPHAVPKVLRLGPLEVPRLDGILGQPGRGVLALHLQ